ncbi:MAG: hypothetical protein ACOCV0_02600 [Alkalispirochaeta sp.]
MEHAVLIAGKQSPFTDDLIQETLRRGDRVFASYDDSDTPPEVPDTFGESLRYIPWNRRSLISSRSLILTIDQEPVVPERVIVVCAPEGVNAPLHEVEAVTIEEKIDTSVKGYLFAIREIAAYFIRRRGGDLTILWYDPGVDLLPPVDAAIAGAVQGFAQSMLGYYENEPFKIRGLSASNAESRAVATWVLEQIYDRTEKSAGRWQKYGQKMGILPFRR